MRIEFIAAGVLVIVLLIAGYFLDPMGWFEEPAQEPVEIPLSEVVPAPAFPSRELKPVTPDASERPLPPLDSSDPEVSEELTVQGMPDAWTHQQELLRRLAVVLDNASRSTYPRSQLGFLAPATGFKVTRNGEQYLVDPKSYRRYDAVVSKAIAIPPPILAAFLSRYGPLVQQALGELGNAKSWREQLTEGVVQLLAVPVVKEPVLLVRPKVMYQFADPELEGLSDLQKQLLRTGPDNVIRVQEYLRALAVQLQLDLAESSIVQAQDAG